MSERIHLLYRAGEFQGKLPKQLNNPFRYRPDELCIAAAKQVEDFLNHSEAGQSAQEGKMFGVLVVKDSQDNLCYLSAFSGLLGQWADHPYFVPPIYDLTDKDGFFKEGEAEIVRINREIERRESSGSYLNIKTAVKESEKEFQEFEKYSSEKLSEAKRQRAIERAALHPGIESSNRLQELDRESMFQKAEHRRRLKLLKSAIASKQEVLNAYEAETEALKRERKEKSSALQERIFRSFRIHDFRNRVKDILDIFSEAGAGYPPGGTGECAAPKLLQYAFIHHLEPISIAEFWYGRTNDSEMRVHGNFYPACTGKCGPLLRYMLGPEITTCKALEDREPEIVYEDPYLIVVNKPFDYLSVPGKSDRSSVSSFIRDRYPEVTGSLVTHRLDMDTSGLLIVARNEVSFRRIRKQFEEKSVRKTYRAIIDGEITPRAGTIDLPIAPDYVNRPRQKVDRLSGKEAQTIFQTVGKHVICSCGKKKTVTEVLLHPLTGRTHQLRIHAAHAEGLGHPILGDPLYGKAADRMYLHAESIEFTHPFSGERLRFTRKADFHL